MITKAHVRHLSESFVTGMKKTIFFSFPAVFSSSVAAAATKPGNEWQLVIATAK